MQEKEQSLSIRKYSINAVHLTFINGLFYDFVLDHYVELYSPYVLKQSLVRQKTREFQRGLAETRKIKETWENILG